MKKIENQNNVLLLADANERASIATIRALNKSGFRLHIALCQERSSIFSFIHYIKRDKHEKSLYEYSGISEQEFINSLIKISRRIGSYILLPSGEKLLRWATKNRAQLEDNFITLPIVDFDLYELVSNKSSFLDYASRNGLNIPKRLELIPKKFDYPYVIKPAQTDWGNAYILDKPILVENKHIHDAVIKKSLQEDSHIVEEYITGPSYYYCALYYHGRVDLSFFQRTILQEPDGGSVIEAIPYQQPVSLIKDIDRMFLNLGWNGVMMIEVKKRKDFYYVIECNPRFWGPLQCALDNGANFPLRLVQLFSGQSCSPVNSNKLDYFPIIGYRWSLGRLNGLIKRWKTGAKFQFFPCNESHRIQFRDIWLRKDSFGFVPLEFGGLLFKILKP